MEGRVIPVALTVLQEMTFYRDGNVFTGVCLSTGVGWLGTHLPPNTWDLGYYGMRSTSGRYASYWNAFLFYSCLYRCASVYEKLIVNV